MRTEEEIRKKIETNEMLIKAKDEGVIDISYNRTSKLLFQISTLNWVLGEPEKNPETRKKIYVSIKPTREEKVISIINNLETFQVNSFFEYFPDILFIDTKRLSINAILKRFKDMGKIKVVSKSGNSYVYRKTKLWDYGGKNGRKDSTRAFG